MAKTAKYRQKSDKKESKGSGEEVGFVYKYH